MCRCELKDLAGMAAFDNLKELYASYNEVSDLFDITYLYNLEVLDLEGNKVEEEENINCLINC